MQSVNQDGIFEKLSSLLQEKHQLALLEAGCGAFSHLKFCSMGLKPFVKTVGIDISREQLDQNADLQEKILGDIQTYALGEEAFDVVACWYVLEHLERPEAALHSMFRTLKPGGLLVLTFPNLMSIKGMVTKLTPFWFHRLMYRFMKYEARPFPTYLRLAILPRRLIQLSKVNGFSVVHWRLVEDELTKRVRNRFWLVRMVFSVANGAARLLSLGRCKELHGDNCELILRKESSTVLPRVR